MSHKPRNYAVTWTCGMHSDSNAAVLSAKKRNTISQISGTDWIYQTLESSANSRPLPWVLGAQRELAQRESIAMLKNVCCLLEWIEYPLKPREGVLSLSDCTVQYTPDDSSMYWTVTILSRPLFSIQVYSSTLLYLLGILLRILSSPQSFRF